MDARLNRVIRFSSKFSLAKQELPLIRRNNLLR